MQVSLMHDYVPSPFYWDVAQICLFRPSVTAFDEIAHRRKVFKVSGMGDNVPAPLF